MVLSRRQKVTIISLLVYWPGIFILAHIPIPRLVYRAHVSDKSLHFLAYLILTFLLWFAVSPAQKVNRRKTRALAVFTVMVWYGVIDELFQGWVGRSCDVFDLLADLAGTLTGLILFSFLSFWPAMLAVTATVIFGLTNLARANLADLVPITNAMFNFFAYVFFTMVWIRYMRFFLSKRAPEAKWIISALIPPAGFLLIVRVFSVILGKPFEVQDVILSTGGILFAVAVSCIAALFRRRSVRTPSADEY